MLKQKSLCSKNHHKAKLEFVRNHMTIIRYLNRKQPFLIMKRNNLNNIILSLI